MQNYLIKVLQLIKLFVYLHHNQKQKIMKTQKKELTANQLSCKLGALKAKLQLKQIKRRLEAKNV